MQFSFNATDLQPLIEQVVHATVAQLLADQALSSDRIAFTEPEAASLLGVARHTLRDARLRGELAGSRVGKKIVYERTELLRFLQQQRQL